MLNVIEKIYSWLGGVEPLPPNQKFALEVVLGQLNVGTLCAENGEWVFTYSDEFRRQTEIKPIVDFPATDREYRSRLLWPFFALRIPSAEQPVVKEFLRRHPAESVDEGLLLREFGGRSIANPFRLVPAA